MILILSILCSTLLILILAAFNSVLAAIVFCGLVLGCLFRGVYLIKQIHEEYVPKKDKVREAVERHLKERELNGIKES